MATKKKVTKKKTTAVAKRATTDVATIQQQLQDEAAGIQGQIGAPSTKAIRLTDKVFTMPDGTVIQDELEVVIVDFISQNKLYEGKYDPKNPEPPVCYAIGKVVNSMVPSPNSQDMQVSKGESCAECPMNQWGSDGDGKACKNTRVLAVVLPDAEETEVYTISVPPTGIKGFDGYVGSIAKLYNLPPIGVKTTISFHPEKTYPLPLFGNPVPNEQLQEHFAFRAEAETLLTVEPEYGVVVEKPARRTKKRA